MLGMSLSRNIPRVSNIRLQLCLGMLLLIPTKTFQRHMLSMKRAKVKKHTVGFFREDAEAPFINLEKFETVTAATSIPHYWRDADGSVSQFWHAGIISKGTGVVCIHRERGMKHTFWTVADPESDLVGKIFIVGHTFKDRKEYEFDKFEYSNISPTLKYSILAEKPLTK
jgi:hypothetical protein